MFNKVKNSIAKSTLGLALAVFSSSAFSTPTSGQIDWISFVNNYGSYQLVFIVGGNLVCNYYGSGDVPGRISAAVTVLTTAKANGKSIAVDCPSANSSELSFNLT